MVDFCLLSLNTHLFGGHWFTPKFKDAQRAADIGEWLSEYQPDVVALQEIWDPKLFYNSIVPMSKYPHAHYGGIKEWIGINSGLGLLSMKEGKDFEQVAFDDEAGIDAFATKGWIRATLTKGDYTITVFNTHTQSEYPRVRENQLWQLGDAVRAFRAEHPDHIVFVVGDLNTYDANLIPALDPGKNMPVDGDTYSNASELKVYFNADAPEGRVDYIFYYESDAHTVELAESSVVIVHGEDGLPASDHWGVMGSFRFGVRPRD